MAAAVDQPVAYAPLPKTEETLSLMPVIDAAFLDMPWHGSRRLARHLSRTGHDAGRCRVRRLMAAIGSPPCRRDPQIDRPASAQYGSRRRRLKILPESSRGRVAANSITFGSL